MITVVLYKVAYTKKLQAFSLVCLCKCESTNFITSSSFLAIQLNNWHVWFAFSKAKCSIECLLCFISQGINSLKQTVPMGTNYLSQLVHINCHGSLNSLCMCVFVFEWTCAFSLAVCDVTEWWVNIQICT